jgi:hypothetical protein
VTPPGWRRTQKRALWRALANTLVSLLARIPQGRALQKKLFTLLDLCVSSLRRGHANLLCIVPILTDDPRRESKDALHTRRQGLRGCKRSSCCKPLMERGRETGREREGEKDRARRGHTTETTTYIAKRAGVPPAGGCVAMATCLRLQFVRETNNFSTHLTPHMLTIPTFKPCLHTAFHNAAWPEPPEAVESSSRGAPAHCPSEAGGRFHLLEPPPSLQALPLLPLRVCRTWPCAVPGQHVKGPRASSRNRFPDEK